MDKMLREGADYELIPVDIDNQQGWDIRILSGDYVESVIRFGNISIDGENDCLNFNFSIISSPDSELTVDDTSLQLTAADILEAVLEEGVEEGTVVSKEQTQ
jgi:hypothetical protein